MTTRSASPPPLVRTHEDGEERPRRPEPHAPVLLTAVAIDELLVAAHDRLGIVQDPDRREHLWDAIHNLEQRADWLARREMLELIATLEGYPRPAA
jgi:hypothetical protein